MKMGRLNLNSTFYLLPFSLFTIFNVRSCTSTSPVLMSNNPLQDIACALINCGEGICQASNESVLGFDCECNSGWKKLQIGPLTFPSCVIPNCTINFSCGNGSPPPPPPPAPLVPPPINFSDPCAMIWCGEGSCVSNGTGHICQCYPDSANLFNNTALACFKECFLGADCAGLNLALPLPSSSPPPPSESSSTGNGPTSASNGSSRKLRALTMTLLTAAMMTWS